MPWSDRQWVAATVFTSLADGDSSFWLARRLQNARGATRYEITEIRSDGSMQTRTFHGWQLGFDARR